MSHEERQARVTELRRRLARAEHEFLLVSGLPNIR